MLTPSDIKNRTLKTTMGGYNKKDTDEFIASILESFEELSSENRKLKEQLTSLSEGIQYYKNLEDNLQKALVLAEKTSDDTKNAAKAEAANIVSIAKAEAADIVSKAKNEAQNITENAKTDIEEKVLEAQKKADELNNKLSSLTSSYDDYKKKIKKIVENQLEFIESEDFSPKAPEYSISNEEIKAVNEVLSDDEVAACENEDNDLESIESENFYSDSENDTLKLEDIIPTNENLDNVNSEDKIFKWESVTEDVNESVETMASELQESLQSEYQESLQNELQSAKSDEETDIDNESDDNSNIVVENIMTTPTLDGIENADVSNTVFPAFKPEKDSVSYLSETQNEEDDNNSFTFIDLD